MSYGAASRGSVIAASAHCNSGALQVPNPMRDIIFELWSWRLSNPKRPPIPVGHPV